MAEKGFKRKLAAILSADVEGYSRLMDDDEEATVRTLTSYRNAITDLVQQFRGRVVDAPGDNLLAEFTSVVDAVNCAVEIQRDLAERNTELAYNRQMQFRIGVNLGDVIEEDGRIYGDGVNIAARVESLSEAGGICISGRAYDQVENKLGLDYENLGEHEVKNITRPIRVYRVLSHPGAAAHRVVQAKETLGRKWRKIAISAAAVVVVVAALGVWQFYMRRPTVEPASVEKMAFPLPDKPSIAVLPFDNLSGDPEQDYLADGISDSIITALSYVPEMFVIARNSSFTYKGKPAKIQQVSEELGVRYILEGSVLKSGDKVRITAQLIDALTGGHIWSERYDRELKELFDLLDEITQAITVELQVKLSHGEQARRWYKSTSNFEAWGYVVKGLSIFYYYTKEAMAKSQALFEQALELDPEYAHAMTMLAWTHFIDVKYGYADSREDSIKQTLELAKKAVTLDDNDPLVHSLWQHIYLIQRQYDKAIEEGRRAIALGPSHAEAHTLFGEALIQSGLSEEAVRICEKAIRLHPHAPIYYYGYMMMAYYDAGRYGESLAVAKQLIEQSRKAKWINGVGWGLQGSALALMELGREVEAREFIAQYVSLRPEIDLEWLRKYSIYSYRKDQASFQQILGSLRKAGMPEHAPLPLPDKPSIAVLAFDNLSGDPEQEYFADGLAEEIITALASVPKLFVIARNSSFTYKGKPVKVQQVSRELGVRYVLEGSVRKAGDRVRITAQLIDARKGNHQWAESYDRKLEDIFVLQDEIAMKVITELQVELTDGERTRMATPCSENLKAYLKCLNARDHYNRMNKQDIEIAQRLAEEAVAIDPGYACAYSLLGGIHIEKLRLGSAKSPKETMATAYKMINKAIALNPSLAGPRGILSLMYRTMGQHEKALTEAEKSLSLNHNSFIANVVMGNALRADGRTEEGLPFLKQATRIDPFNPNGLSTLGFSYILTGQYGEAIQICKKSADLNSENIYSQLCLASVYSATGREEEANAAAAEVIKINSRFSTEHFLKSQKFKKKEDNEFLISTFRKAGLPE